MENINRIFLLLNHQRGEQVFMKNLERSISVIIPLDKQVREETLNNIIKKVVITMDERKKLV